MNDPGAYVVRSTRAVGAGLVTVAIVDLAGRVRHVTVLRHLTTTEHLDPVLRFATANARTPPLLP